MEKENGNLKYNEIWIAQRADPYVLKAPSGCYYFTASVPAYDSVVLRRADTLAGLVDAEEIVVWRKHESGPMSLHVWAPEIHYLFGNGIFISRQVIKMIYGKSALMYWNARGRTP